MLQVLFELELKVLADFQLQLQIKPPFFQESLHYIHVLMVDLLVATDHRYKISYLIQAIPEHPTGQQHNHDCKALFVCNNKQKQIMLSVCVCLISLHVVLGTISP